MSDKSYYCYSKAEVNRFCESLLGLIGVSIKVAFVGYTTYYLFDKSIEHSYQIRNLFSRVSECERLQRKSNLLDEENSS